MNNNSSIIDRLKEHAYKSTLEHKLSACLIKSNKIISDIHINTSKIINKNNYTNTTHAERNVLQTYFGSSYYYKNDIPIYNNNKKNKKNNNNKINLLVIRVNKNNELCNARPCLDCLQIMKSLKINKIYYSISENLIVEEKVKDMLSIHISSYKLYTNIGNYKLFNNKKILNDYYEKIINLQLVNQINTDINNNIIIKKLNFDLFIKYNVSIIIEKYFIIRTDNTIKLFISNNCIICFKIIE